MSDQKTEQKTPKLKPCPFCGGAAEFCAQERGFTAYLSAFCTSCGASSARVVYSIRHNGIDPETRDYIPPKDRKKEVRGLWNLRAASDQEAA